MRSLFKMQQVDAGIVPQRVLGHANYFQLVEIHGRPTKPTWSSKNFSTACKSEPGVLSAAISSRYPFEPEMITDGPESVSFHFKSKAALWNRVKRRRSAHLRQFLQTTSRLLEFLSKAGRLLAETDRR